MQSSLAPAVCLQICMGTFVLTFIGRSLSAWIEEAKQLARLVPKHDMRRKMMVIAYFVTIALIIGVFGVLTIPYIVREGADFISRLQAENIWCAPRHPPHASPGSTPDIH